ncbi:hypothetical protein [uncultured Spirosoma sp.]|uniref:hypothetical protein n=1 Tax=uncultured Spirosoma sp. TaxID=278208 RepID=UPI00259023B2|nr:hypothetical protein [uncultured Spirosoma sp.]
MSELATNPAQAKAQIQSFLTAPFRTTSYDLLIKSNPFRLIRARIAYESETTINYTTPVGAAASISQAELAVILYQDGRHRLIAPVGEAISVLVKAREAVNDTSSTISLMATETPSDEQPDSLYKVQLSGSIDNTALPANTNDGTVPDSTLSVAQKELYRQQSLVRVDEFVSYLSVITDQSVDSEVRDKALDSASRLFLPESTIEVTSARRHGIRRYSIRLYLTRLKLLPYLSARIDWVQTQFVDDLTANPDGTYSGIVTGQQTFSGYGTNGQPAYTDITPKSVRVRLDHRPQTPSEPLRWKVFLGNIRIAVD